MLDDVEAGDWAQFMKAAPVSAPGEYTLRGAYRLLIILFIVAMVVALGWPDHPYVERFAPNAATEIFGIIITLTFVHRLLYRQERSRRMRASIGAYRRSNWTLSHLVHVWADVIKGCHQGEDLPRTLPRLFAPHITESIALLDAQQPVSAEAPVTWAQRLRTEMETAMAQLNRIILSYGGVLDPAYTEAIDELIDHPFVRLMEDLTATSSDAQTWRVRLRTNRGHAEDFFTHLLRTVALHNQLAAEAAGARSRGRSPRSGTLGMELERDHDLKISVELTNAWRRAAPAPGSLVA